MFAPYNSVSTMHYVIEYHPLPVTEVSVSVVDYGLPKERFCKSCGFADVPTNSLDTISCYALQSQQPNTLLLLVYNTPLHGTLHN